MYLQGRVIAFAAELLDGTHCLSNSHQAQVMERLDQLSVCLNSLQAKHKYFIDKHWIPMQCFVHGVVSCMADLTRTDVDLLQGFCDGRDAYCQATLHSVLPSWMAVILGGLGWGSTFSPEVSWGVDCDAYPMLLGNGDLMQGCQCKRPSGGRGTELTLVPPRRLASTPPDWVVHFFSPGCGDKTSGLKVSAKWVYHKG